jgi:hypothetical protein
MKIATVGKEVVFSINTSLVGNRIQLVISEEINGVIFNANFYNELKEFYQKMIEKQNEKIVLIKI